MDLLQRILSRSKIIQIKEKNMKIASLMLALSLTTAGFTADMTYTGYLTDKACGAAGSSKMDGSSETNAPQEHTVACQIACAKSGYGVMLQEGSTYKFVPFDAKGSAMATKLLKTTKKTKGPIVMVTGTQKDGVIQVASMMEH